MVMLSIHYGGQDISPRASARDARRSQAKAFADGHGPGLTEE